MWSGGIGGGIDLGVTNDCSGMVPRDVCGLWFEAFLFFDALIFRVFWQVLCCSQAIGMSS